MSSYANAAASSGPAKNEKLPKPARVEPTSEPHGSVETVDGKEFDKKRKEVEKEADKLAAEAKDTAKKQANAVKKEIEKLEDQSAPYLDKAVNFFKQQYAKVVSTVSNINGDSFKAAGTELQNPVVISQLALIVGGATAGWFVYSERAHIRSDNKYVVAIHAGIVTALVLGDAYVFQKLYPKYKKN